MDAVGKLIRLVLCGGALSFSLIGYAHRSGHPNDEPKQVYRFEFQDYRAEMQVINSLGFDVAGVNLHKNIIDLVLTPAELTSARDFVGLRLLDMVDDGNNDLDPEYHTAAEVASSLAEYANRYPDLSLIKSIGKSHEGRDIWAIKISDNVSVTESEEPVVLFNSMHHAREVMTTEVAMDTIDFLLTRYSTDAQVRSWVDSNEVWVVPMLNVDGNNKVWTSYPMWRKNTREGHGVDLNRNYPYGWNSCNGSSGMKWSDTYRGPSAGSEPESQALMRLVDEIRPVFDISYHSYSELVIYPFGCNGVRTANQEVVESIGKKMASLLPSDDNDGYYTPGTSWEVLYSVDGGDIDWMHHTYGVVPYVIEVSSTNEGFQPRYSEWRNKTVAKMRAAWQMLLDRTQQSGIRGQVHLNSGRLAQNVNAKIDSVSNPNLSPRTAKLRADGVFHEILTPGTYHITITDGQHTLPPETIVVGDRLETLELEF